MLKKLFFIIPVVMYNYFSFNSKIIVYNVRDMHYTLFFNPLIIFYKLIKSNSTLYCCNKSWLLLETFLELNSKIL